MPESPQPAATRRRTCSTCDHYDPPKGKGNGYCHARRPDGYGIPIQPAFAGATPSLMTFAIWPPVAPTDWCGDWAPPPQLPEIGPLPLRPELVGGVKVPA